MNVKKLIAVAAVAASAALPSFAADWTDASGNEYTALKSLKTSGSQWILITDFDISCTDIVKMKFTSSTANSCQGLWCSRMTGTTQFSAFYSVGANKKISFYRKGTYIAHSQVINADEDCSVVANYGTREFTVNGTSQTLSGTSFNGDYTGIGAVMLFATYTAGKPTGTTGNKAYYDLYYYEFYDSASNLKHCLMPAKNASGVAGLYDTVGRKFYGPTSGTFNSADRTVSGSGRKWTGLGGDNRMSTPANWEGGVAPVAGDDLDFTLAPPLVEINADIDAIFGKVWIDDGDIPAFVGSLTATDVNDLQKMQDYDTATAGFTFTVASPLFTWNGTGVNWSDSGAWTSGGLATDWSDGNNAIFATANAAAALTSDASADTLSFNAAATVGGTATLAVPSVFVAPNVSAVISASTSGALEKTGAGTLTLSQNRADATTVTEGTLKMDGATVSTLTLGTGDATKSVVFDYGGQTLQRNPSDYLVNGADITLTNGTFASTASTSSLNIRDTAKLPSVLTISKDTTLKTGKSGAQSVFDTGALDTTATINIVGGTLDVAGDGFFQHTAKKGRFNFNVRDGLVEFGSAVKAICSYNAGTYVNPSLYMTFDNSTFRIKNADMDFNFGYDSQSEANRPTTPTGVIAATNSVFVIGHAFHIGRNSITAKTGGSYTADFEGCIITAKYFAVYYDRPLNNARLNNTRFVLNSNGSVGASDDADNWYTVGPDGMTYDTRGYTGTLNANFGGSGAVTKAGSGKLIVGKNQTSTGALIVNEGTLSVNGGVSIARPTTFASGTALDLAGHSAGVAPFVAAIPTTPANATIDLTFNGGAFPTGVYAICSAAGVTAAEGAKFTPSTGGETAAWSVVGNTLVLTVGTPSGNVWTGLAGDGKMSTDANWTDGSAPVDGEDVDFSDIKVATTIEADIANVTFGTVTMGDGVITFTNSVAATNFTDTSKISVGADSTVTIVGNLEISGEGDRNLVYTIAEGGRFVVTGDIIATETFAGANLYPSATVACPGKFVARGLANRGTNGRSFRLARNSGGSHVTWVIGDHGISSTGTAGFWVFNVNNTSATIISDADFTIAALIGNRTKLVLNTTGQDGAPHTITIGDGTTGLLDNDGLLETTGAGKVLFNCVSTFSGGLAVKGTSTLAVNPGCQPCNCLVHVYTGAGLEIAQSGTVELAGNLKLDNNTALAFNFTDRSTVPTLALAEGKSVVFTEGASTNIAVKVSGVRPKGGAHALTSCGGFDAEGVSVSLASDAPEWVKGVSVDADGNLVLDVKRRGMMLIVK